MKLHQYTGAEVKALRKAAKLNQGEFWGRFGVTQSGGSRYEIGRDIPDAMNILLNIALGDEATSASVVTWMRSKSSMSEGVS
ncbi:MAG: helix-turn-helix domain-containing protein [Novosphingobium sp.]